jgi:hypothetical protein
MRKLAILITLTSAMALTGTASAAMYKWVDEEGNIHYSQTPPAGKETETIAPPPRVTAPAGQQQKAEEEGESPAAAQPQSDKSETLDEHQAEINRKNCETATKNLAIYQNSKRIRTPEGKVMRLSEEMRQQKIEETQKAIDKYCK